MMEPVAHSPFPDALAGYPPWLVVAAAAVAAALALWLLSRVIKWMLWLLAIAVLVVGGGLAIWLLVAR
jgi:hypothetical protein